MPAAALSPDKSSLAAEKLKENLRAEGVLEQLVFAVLRHSTQQGQSVSTSSEVDSHERYEFCQHPFEFMLQCTWI